MKILERYVAIDNVCAWPNLTRMPDGSVAAVVYNQPIHGGWEGDVDCWVSDGNCRIWKHTGTAAIHEPGCNRLNVAAGLSASGDLLVIASGTTKAVPPGSTVNSTGSEFLPSLICRSSDGGRTWKRHEGVSPAPKGEKGLIPFGDIIRLPSGGLGVCMYGWNPPDENNSYFYTSSDDGETWSCRAVIRASDINETTPLVVQGRGVFAAGRTWHDQYLELFLSEDEGTTWKHLLTLTMPNQHPAHMLLLRDGRILLTYGIRNKGLYGVGGRISSDSGLTWGAPFVLADFQFAAWGDGGYPSSVECDDGCIATAYYSSGVPFHQRYHMGVVRWKPE